MTPQRIVPLQRWRLAIENAIFGVWDLDPCREMVHYSPQWKARFGFPRIHEPDSTGFWRCRVHPDDLEPMQGSLRSHLAGQVSSYEMRFRVRSNGSGYRTVLSRGRVVERDAGGNATRMVGTMIDLTGRPATMSLHGLATEDPQQPVETPCRPPLHAILGATGSPHEPHPLIEQIGDLLELALSQGSATR
ncbi:MAG: PAS domain-containing protein [Rhizobacter sp.]|nr:PAS domain-containing protein [Rhizobacter sp.]